MYHSLIFCCVSMLARHVLAVKHPGKSFAEGNSFEAGILA